MDYHSPFRFKYLTQSYSGSDSNTIDVERYQPLHFDLINLLSYLIIPFIYSKREISQIVPKYVSKNSVLDSYSAILSCRGQTALERVSDSGGKMLDIDLKTDMAVRSDK